MRPFLQRVFVVLWLIWGLLLGALIFWGIAVGLRDAWEVPFATLIGLWALAAVGSALPVMLLQYLVLGFFSPLRLFASKSPPA
jgi:hypothetical protein